MAVPTAVQGEKAMSARDVFVEDDQPDARVREEQAAWTRAQADQSAMQGLLDDIERDHAARIGQQDSMLRFLVKPGFPVNPNLKRVFSVLLFGAALVLNAVIDASSSSDARAAGSAIAAPCRG
jgi:hypothetical protein